MKCFLPLVKWLWWDQLCLLVFLPTSWPSCTHKLTESTTESITVKQQREIRGGSHRRSLNILGFYHFIIILQANFILLITITEEKPEQLTTPEIEVCHVNTGTGQSWFSSYRKSTQSIFTREKICLINL